MATATNTLMQPNPMVHGQSKTGFTEPPRFLVPTASLSTKRSASGTMKRMVQRLFGSKSSRDLVDTDGPLIPHEDTKPRYSKKNIAKTLSTIGSGLLLGKHQQNDTVVAQEPVFEYTLSCDELTKDGLAAAPPTPITDSTRGRLEQAVSKNYEACMRHCHTALPVSLAELQSMIARETAENIRISEQDCRVYLVPIDGIQANPAFLSRSQPTRLGRNAKQLQVKSRVISRNHCQVFMEQEGDKRVPFVVDVASHTGTFVNGVRLSPSGTISSPMRLFNGDILQLGCTLSGEDDSDGSLRSIAFLVLTGYQLRDSSQQPTNIITDALLSQEKSSKLYQKAMSAMSDSNSAVLYVEFGDLLHDNTFGMAMLARRDGPCYAARFNNYKMTWEAAIELVGSPGKRMNCQVMDAAETVFAVSEQESNGKEKRIARISVKDKRYVVVTPISEQRSSAAVNNQTPINVVTLQRPASPYLSIAPNSSPQSPTNSIRSLASPLLSPRLDTLTTHLQDTLMISRPEIPYYCLDLPNGTVTARDKNNQEKEKLLGTGSCGNGGGVLKWGKRVLVWQGDLAPCRDDMLVVLGLLIQRLVNM